jgi:hypothetical protein
LFCATGLLEDSASVALRSGFTKKSPLSEQSELYLCETVGLLTVQYHLQRPEGGRGEVGHIDRLRAIVEGQLSQLHSALCLLAEQPQLSEVLCLLAAQRVNALAGLTKGFSGTTCSEAVPVFESASAAIVAVSQRLGFHAGVRAKVLVYQHRMVACIGPRAIAYAHHIVSALLQHAEMGDVDAVVQVLNQLLVEYEGACYEVVDALYGAVEGKYVALAAYLDASSGASVAAGGGGSINSNSGGGGGSVEAPHVQTERLSLQRQYLLFVQHVVLYGCAAVLYGPSYLHRLEHLLVRVVLVGITGGGPDLLRASASASAAGLDGVAVGARTIGGGESADTVPVRKGALSILNGLVTAWLLPPTATTASPTAAATALRAANVHVPILPAVPAEVAAAFRSYLLDQAVPRAVYTVSAWCTHATGSSGADLSAAARVQQMNVKDAASQSVLVEIAALLRGAHGVLAQSSNGNNNSSMMYFPAMLQSLGWTDHRIQGFMGHLIAATPLGSYKDAFKVFIRECSV